MDKQRVISNVSLNLTREINQAYMPCHPCSCLPLGPWVGDQIARCPVGINDNQDMRLGACQLTGIFSRCSTDCSPLFVYEVE